MVLFPVQIAEGKAIEDALTYANVAASLSTEKVWSTDRNADRRRSRDRVKEIVRSAKEKRKDRITTVKGVEMKKRREL